MLKKRCGYFKSSGTGSVCKASFTKMAPSTFEFQVYCDTEEHYRCPLLVARTLRDGFRENAVRAGLVLSR